MPQKSAKTPAEFMANLPPERRKEVAKVRKVIKQNLPKGYREAMNWGAISYEVPLSKYPDTYNGQPLCYAALGAHKSFLTLYLMSVYGDSKLLKKFKDGFKKAGKKLDMGKSCVHFHTADDLPLDLIGKTVAAVPMEKWIELAKGARRK